MVVAAPCPGNTAVSGGSFLITSLSVLLIVSSLPVGRSTLPTLPANKVSPVKAAFLKASLSARSSV